MQSSTPVYRQLMGMSTDLNIRQPISTDSISTYAFAIRAAAISTQQQLLRASGHTYHQYYYSVYKLTILKTPLAPLGLSDYRLKRYSSVMSQSPLRQILDDSQSRSDGLEVEHMSNNRRYMDIYTSKDIDPPIAISLVMTTTP